MSLPPFKSWSENCKVSFWPTSKVSGLREGTRNEIVLVEYYLIAIDITSKGVKGHFPFNLIAPGRITRPRFVNFPFHPLSLAASISFFSLSPPSYIQQENATISCKRELKKKQPRELNFKPVKQNRIMYYVAISAPSRLTSSKRRWTEIYLPLLFALLSFIRATSASPKLKIGFEKRRAS